MTGGRIRVVGPGTAPGSTVTPADLLAHETDTADAHDASAVSVVPFGSVAATDVQAALQEIVTEEAASHPNLATHDALGLATDAELATHAALTTHTRVAEPSPVTFVSTTGDDSFDGRWDRPLLTPAAAIAARSLGGRIKFGPGHFQFTGSDGLAIGNVPVTLEGVGRRLTFLDYLGPGKALTIGAGGSGCYAWGLEKLSIGNPWTNAGNKATHGVYLNYAREGYMEDVAIWPTAGGFTTAGLYLFGVDGNNGNWTNRFERMYVAACAGDGVYLGPGSNSDHFHGCLFNSNANGMRVHFAQGVTISQSQFEGNVQAGVWFTGKSTENGKTIGFSMSQCYTEIGGPGKRLVLIDEGGGGHVSVENLDIADGFYSGNGTEYAIEANTPSGSWCYGTVRGGTFYAVETAGVRTTTANDKLWVMAHRALNSALSPVPLLDTNGGAGGGVLMTNAPVKYVEQDQGLYSPGGLAGKYKEGVGPTISDADFSFTPINGFEGLTRDTSTNKVTKWVRAGGLWKAVEFS